MELNTREMSVINMQNAKIRVRLCSWPNERYIHYVLYLIKVEQCGEVTKPRGCGFEPL